MDNGACYSNIDAGLLGILLGRRAGSTFDALLAARITNPMKLGSTAITVTSDMTSRLVTGHDPRLNKAPRFSVTFEVDSGGQVTRMLLRSPTGNVPATRVQRQ